MHRLLATLSLVLFTTVALAQSSPDSNGRAEHPVNFDGCALVVGGSVGSSFSEPQIAGFWHEANKSISGHLFDRLILDQYQVVRLTIEASEAPKIKDVIVQTMARQKCNRVLQVANDVGEDVRGKYFGFIVSLLRVVPKDATAPDATNTVLLGEYTKTYRYPRTTESFDSFRTGVFARTVFDDIKASGALSPLVAR